MPFAVASSIGGEASTLTPVARSSPRGSAPRHDTVLEEFIARQTASSAATAPPRASWPHPSGGHEHGVVPRRVSVSSLRTVDFSVVPGAGYPDGRDHVRDSPRFSPMRIGSGAPAPRDDYRHPPSGSEAADAAVSLDVSLLRLL